MFRSRCEALQKHSALTLLSRPWNWHHVLLFIISSCAEKEELSAPPEQQERSSGEARTSDLWTWRSGELWEEEGGHPSFPSFPANRRFCIPDIWDAHTSSRFYNPPFLWKLCNIGCKNSEKKKNLQPACLNLTTAQIKRHFHAEQLVWKETAGRFTGVKKKKKKVFSYLEMWQKNCDAGLDHSSSEKKRKALSSSTQEAHLSPSGSSSSSFILSFLSPVTAAAFSTFTDLSSKVDVSIIIWASTKTDGSFLSRLKIPDSV